MSASLTYPAGVPCWVETLQPDPRAAERFYGPLLGWAFDGNEARLGGRLVAGLGQTPPGAPALWATFIAVDDIRGAVERVKDAGGASLTDPAPRGTAGHYAIVADSSGVAFCLWEARDRAGAEVAQVPNAWARSSLHSPDPVVAASFYKEVFGWDLEPGPTFSRWWLGDRLVAVVSGTSPAVPPHWAVAFAVEDPDAIAVSAVELGGSILMPPTDTPGFRSAVILDPQGGVFGVTATGRNAQPDPARRRSTEGEAVRRPPSG